MSLKTDVDSVIYRRVPETKQKIQDSLFEQLKTKIQIFENFNKDNIEKYILFEPPSYDYKELPRGRCGCGPKGEVTITMEYEILDLNKK